MILQKLDLLVVANLAAGVVGLVEQEDGIAVSITQPKGVQSRSGARIRVLRLVCRLHAAETVQKPTPRVRNTRLFGS